MRFSEENALSRRASAKRGALCWDFGGEQIEGPAKEAERLRAESRKKTKLDVVGAMEGESLHEEGG